MDSPAGTDHLPTGLLLLATTTTRIQSAGVVQFYSAHMVRNLSALDRSGNRWRISSLYGIRAWYAAREGRWVETRRLTDEAQRWWSDDGRVIALRAWIEYETGQTDQGDHWLQRLLDLVDRARTPDERLAGTGGLASLVLFGPRIARATGRRDILERVLSAADLILRGREARNQPSRLLSGALLSRGARRGRAGGYEPGDRGLPHRYRHLKRERSGPGWTISLLGGGQAGGPPSATPTPRRSGTSRPLSSTGVQVNGPRWPGPATSTSTCS